MYDLIRLFLDTGLLQFGSFDRIPFRWNFEYLPSYPNVLVEIAERLEPQLQPADHLVSAPSMLPFALALSLKTGIPLAYGIGDADNKPTIVGAYDIGHPAILVMEVIEDEQAVIEYVRYAGRVGLDIVQVVTIIRVGRLERLDLPHTALLDMESVVLELYQRSHITAFQHETIRRWLINHHPDSATP